MSVTPLPCIGSELNIQEAAGQLPSVANISLLLLPALPLFPQASNGQGKQNSMDRNDIEMTGCHARGNVELPPFIYR